MRPNLTVSVRSKEISGSLVVAHPDRPHPARASRAPSHQYRQAVALSRVTAVGLESLSGPFLVEYLLGINNYLFDCYDVRSDDTLLSLTLRAAGHPSVLGRFHGPLLQGGLYCQKFRGPLLQGAEPKIPSLRMPNTIT